VIGLTLVGMAFVRLFMRLKGCWLADDHVLFTEPTNVRTGKQRKAS